MLGIPSISNARIRRIKWLVCAGAAMLLAGVLLFCHGEIRRSRYMVEMQSARTVIENWTEQDTNRWDAMLESFDRERWLALQWLAPMGAGTLASSLFISAVSRRCQFTMRTQLLAMLYVIILIGTPFGLVRPQLQNPRIWLRPGTPDIAFGQLRPWPQAGLGSSQNNPWENAGPTTRFEFSLANRDSMLVAIAAFIVLPLSAFLPVPKRQSVPSLTDR